VLHARNDVTGARESFERAVALDEDRAVFQAVESLQEAIELAPD